MGDMLAVQWAWHTVTRMVEYVVWLEENAYESGEVKLEDLPGFIECNYRGTEDY